VKYNIIKACKASEFISNLQEISNYYSIRKKVPVITNTNRLINILSVYFKTLLYYLDNSPNKFLVKIKEKSYIVKINGHTETGSPTELDLEDISDQLIKNVICDLAKTINPTIFGDVAQLLNSILLTPNIAQKYKISVINGENNLPQGSWYTLVRQTPEKLAIETIEIRKDFIFRATEAPENHLFDQENKQGNISTIHKAYELYIKTLLRVHIYNNHYDEIYSSIISCLEELIDKPNNEYLDKNRLVLFLLTQLVMNNNIFQIERKDYLREVIEEHSQYIKENDLNTIYEGLNFSPEDFEIGKFSIELFEPNFSEEDLGDIKTVISFVVPYCTEGAVACKLDDRAEIFFSNITNLFDDPVYSFLDSSEISISGMPLTLFSDSIGAVLESTKIDIVMNQFYHPDFELIENEVVPVDLKKEEAKRGGRYFPHKDQILEYIWELQSDGRFPFQIKDLNSDFISNYLVSYCRSEGKLIHHKLFTITNFDSYFKTKNKFVNNLNKHYMSEDIPEIRAYILDTKITNKRSFSGFCYRLLEMTLKKSIEFGGLNESFWIEEGSKMIPVLERKAQPIIYNQIRFLAAIKGISLSREVIAANGSLDFHFSYTKNDVLMNVCVELKNAHHGNIEHGITTQLPLYIKDIGAREGIFLVLWYKSGSFNKPSVFSDIKEFEGFLLERSPKKFRIKPLVIDCSPKVSPSLKQSKKRLNQN